MPTTGRLDRINARLISANSDAPGRHHGARHCAPRGREPWIEAAKVWKPWRESDHVDEIVSRAVNAYDLLDRERMALCQILEIRTEFPTVCDGNLHLSRRRRPPDVDMREDLRKSTAEPVIRTGWIARHCLLDQRGVVVNGDTGVGWHQLDNSR
jgi:hypothetical protein